MKGGGGYRYDEIITDFWIVRPFPCSAVPAFLPDYCWGFPPPPPHFHPSCRTIPPALPPSLVHFFPFIYPSPSLAPLPCLFFPFPHLLWFLLLLPRSLPYTFPFPFSLYSLPPPSLPFPFPTPLQTSSSLSCPMFQVFTHHLLLSLPYLSFLSSLILFLFLLSFFCPSSALTFTSITQNKCPTPPPFT
jgi:hypothetical protein